MTASRIAANASRATLVVLREDGARRHVLPERGVVRIGRSSACEVSLPGDPLLSRVHAEVRIGERITIVDLGSSNGTRVGRRAIPANLPYPIAPDDVVSVGSTYIVVEGRPDEPVSIRENVSRLAPTGFVEDGALAKLRPMIERFAEGSIPVLILGETGAGKDVVASMIHRASPRASRPMVCLNCAALPEALLESELFGYERGAFTGASQAKAGILESAGQAGPGTVFLDEVGEMPLSIQAKLLRVLDQREVLRLGATRPRAIDVRFIAATNRDLESEVIAGRFRSDLFFRLAAASISVPPLRERTGEVATLARAFAERACRELGYPSCDFTAAAMDRLERHAWPGNVRELKNAVERAVLLTRGGTIDVTHLALRATPAPLLDPADTLRPSDIAKRALNVPLPVGSSPSMAPPSSEEEKARILDALARCSGNQTQAARVLGMSRRTLVARLSSYGLTRKRRPD